MTDGDIARLQPRASTGGPKVTVVMPTYRRPHHVGETIRSLLNGTWTDFELLVRDDGDGNDGTAEAVATAAQGDERVRYHRNEKNLRMPDNLNAGIAQSRGDLIAVCHDHDIYKPAFLATMVETLDRHPTALFVHCGIEVISQSGARMQRHVGDWPELSPGSAWLKFMLQSLHCPVCALTVVRRETHEQYGLYDPLYGFIADVEMWMRLARYGDVAYVAQPLIQVREREADHMATTNTVPLLQAAAKIHRRYIPYAYDAQERWLKRLSLELHLSRRVIRNRVSDAARQMLLRREDVAQGHTL